LLALLFMLLPLTGGAAEPGEVAARPQAPAGKPRIGRIFFSPAERRLRHEGKPGPVASAPTAADVPRNERLLVNGAVSSSTRGRAVWVNGVVVENSAHHGMAWTDLNGRVWLRDERQNTRVVRPGQAIDRSSGALEDLLPVGSVTRH
jgi:hypothetical protein